MNAVVRSVPTPERPALAALRGYRDRMLEIKRQAEPLRGQLAALRTNLSAAEQECTAAAATVDHLRDSPTPNFSDVAAKEAEVRTLERRVEALRRAVGVKEAELGSVEARVQQESTPLLVLQHRVLVEGAFEAAIDRATAAERELAAAELECEAVAIAIDEIAQAALAQHRMPLEQFAARFRVARANKAQNRRQASLSDAPRPDLQARVREIRARLEAE